MLKLKGKKVRELIGGSGLSVRAWGETHGFAQSTLSSWLNGTRNIKKKQLVKLSEALRVENLNEISFVEFRIDESKRQEIKNEIEEISHLWGYLPQDQRQTILSLIRSIAGSNIEKDEPETRK